MKMPAASRLQETKRISRIVKIVLMIAACPGRYLRRGLADHLELVCFPAPACSPHAWGWTGTERGGEIIVVEHPLQLQLNSPLLPKLVG